MSASKLIRAGGPADTESAVRQTRWQRWADALARVALLILAVDYTLSLILGSLIATRWPFLEDWGGGFGGGNGLPVLGYVLAVVLGVPSLLAAIQDPSKRVGRLLAFVGPFIILVGFAGVSHALDPCVTGLWDASSRLGSQPLCERFGGELNIHTRFHLLHHALVPTVVLVPLYWLALGRLHPPVTWVR